MLYEVIATVRPHSIAEVKDIARTAGNLILQNGGVIRGFTNWGVMALPKPLPNRSASISNSSNRTADPYSANLSNKHTIGHYFIMRFDSSAHAQHTLRKTWAGDPRLLRFSVVKLGDTLKAISDVGGKAEEWAHVEGNEGSTGISFSEEQRLTVDEGIRNATEGTTMKRIDYSAFANAARGL
ncbi:ribosomal protein S6 [Verruconis gallopava]|uniref:Ribosomal protein S6 n=1 Tax=Verruconis gallopava TaxID=253628 RepID=A0A0D2A080_9PEZI|nr:ribosomal protein S6 [Verruconis gallopava]KIW00003.1 ribosomal protein S6 [Verruconis gallopava]